MLSHHGHEENELIGTLNPRQSVLRAGKPWITVNVQFAIERGFGLNFVQLHLAKNPSPPGYAMFYMTHPAVLVAAITFPLIIRVFISALLILFSFVFIQACLNPDYLRHLSHGRRSISKPC